MELVDWVISQGGSLNDCVRVAQDASRGVHIQVKGDWPQPISKETKVLSTPIGATMSYFNAIGFQTPQATFSKHGVELPQAFIDAVAVEETCTFFLMGQFLRGPQGFWYPYLRTLPQPGELNTPLFFGEEDVDWIQGTGIPEAAVQRYQVWDERYEQCMSKLEEAGFEGLEEYTCVVETSKLEEDSGVSVLLPLIDLPNHRPLAKVEWRAGSSDIGMVVLEEVGPGHEISNNYGPRNNEQLLMNYGFCLPNNPTDYRIIKLGVKPDSNLSKAKNHQIELFPEVANNKEDHYYIFNVFYPLLGPDTAMEHSIFSPALFNSLTIMHANERERKQIQITESAISIPPSLRKWPQHSGSTISDQLRIYRNGLLTLDKAALVIATWTLARARDHNRGESWEDIKTLLNEHMLQIPEGHFSVETLSRIRVRILERESLLKKNGELFRLGELFSLLPADMQAASRECFNHVLAQAGQQVSSLQTNPEALFALVLCLLVATGRSAQARPELSSRLTRWVDFLVEQYPMLTVPSVASDTVDQLIQFVQSEQAQTWTAQDGVHWLSEDSGWLDSNWLKWAYTVAEAEMVLIPHEPLQVLVTENPGLPKLGCLYVPQE
ncbi:uncharacterized protein N7458_001876 [Penicillium daleae]|uniref:SET domain-containing protein n=1 Tax=Penicillium daleae TaxID=63821 RepID=A0AAD6CCH8_9EURO|nr:uncharacterized protein N7458_001876 [Penicillium daleae]KAJ5460324.1 hypothetical protein N7458_001876 [Penicillium daleae]